MEQVVHRPLLLHASEAGGKVVRAVDEEAAGLLRETADYRTRASRGNVRHVWTIREPQLTPPLPAFNRAIVRAVRQWQYEPFVVRSRATPICLTMPVNVEWRQLVKVSRRSLIFSGEWVLVNDTRSNIEQASALTP